MFKQKCPNCKVEGISIWRRLLFVNSWAGATCCNCGVKFVIPIWQNLLMSVFSTAASLVAVYYALVLKSWLLIIMFIVFLMFLPLVTSLVPKESK